MHNRKIMVLILCLSIFVGAFWMTGMLVMGEHSPRTGEYFKDTKYCEISPVWIFLMKAKFIPPVGRAVLIPFAYIGAAMEIFTNPIRDVLMLPIDVNMPRHGYYIRVVDENINPVVNASVRVFGYGEGLMVCREDVGCSDTEGMFYIKRLGYLPSHIDVVADGFIELHGGLDVCRDMNGDYLHGSNWRCDAYGRKIYTVVLKRHQDYSSP